MLCHREGETCASLSPKYFTPPLARLPAPRFSHVRRRRALSARRDSPSSRALLKAFERWLTACEAPSACASVDLLSNGSAQKTPPCADRQDGQRARVREGAAAKGRRNPAKVSQSAGPSPI